MGGRTSSRTVSKSAAEIKHGTPGGYRKGCRCRRCTQAKSAQRAQERARRREREAAASRAPVIDEPVQDPPSESVGDGERESRPVGQVESAVRDELALHEGSSGVAPLAAVAVALAIEIDDAAGMSVAGAARQLVATLSEIRKLTTKADGELEALLAAMGRA